MSMDLHRRQDLRSLALHRAAVQALTEHPERVQQVLDVLSRWEKTVDPLSLPLLHEWRRIVEAKEWRLALEESEKGQQLRQASPLGFVLPQSQRRAILDAWSRLNTGG